MMNGNKIINFSPGPAKIHSDVLAVCKEGIDNYNGTGLSVMEISHRGKHYSKINADTEQLVRDLLEVPDNYKVLFLSGGGSGQFSGVPLNLMRGDKPRADYVITGTWSAKAAKEAEKYVKVNRVFPPLDIYNSVPPSDKWTMDPGASYLYYCANETVHGVEVNHIPDTQGVPIVADMSSNLFTRSVDVSKFGVIYAGAQKNIGCAGVTLVIVREDLISAPSPICPVVLEYKSQATNQSIYNTPPVWNVYVMGEVFKWIQESGGVVQMEKLSQRKSEIIYKVIEESDGFYWNPVEEKSRSRINIPVRITGPDGSSELEASFLKQAESRGLLSLKGHRSVGGLRISLFNAISLEETVCLRDFMIEFKENTLMESQ